MRLIVAAASALLVAGCAATPEPDIQRVALKPDPQLLQDCPVPQPGRNDQGQITVGSNLEWSADLLSSLMKCNADKKALRMFYVEQSDGQETKP